MSGGGGGSIIIHSVSRHLGDPIIHGQLSVPMQLAISPILAKPEDQWTMIDKMIIANVYSWAIVNLQ